MKLPNKILLLIFSVGLVIHPAALHAADLTASDGEYADLFGISVNQSGALGLVGAFGDDSYRGSAYVFRNLDAATGTVTQNVKLTASDGAAYDYFGHSVSQSGTLGLVGADRKNTFEGAAYVFRNLDSATGTVTQNVKLTASDLAGGDAFGMNVSLSGTTGLVGSQYSAYVFRNLDTATGTVTQNVKLTPSDGGFVNTGVSLDGTIGLVGGQYNGAAYVFRNLDTATGTVTQNAKLTASGGLADDYFGSSVSLSGSTGLIGAQFATVGGHANQGAAYVFRNLDTATGTVTQNVKLTASDGAANDRFGLSVNLSGSTGLIGAQYATVGGHAIQGAAYVFRNLDTATGIVTQNVKLTASDGAAGDLFGSSMSLDGDQFVIGAPRKNFNKGKAYSGSISSVTTLDTGNTSKTISGLSFTSQDHWIIGQTTSSNQVTLSAGDSANVTASGKAVYVGQNAGANNNALTINGTLTANQVNVGAAGNTGNHLEVNGTVTGPVNVASGSTLGGHGFVSTITGAGTVAPGNSPGILTATSVDPSGGMDFAFQFTSTGSPNYNPAGPSFNSLNDVLHLTGGTPFTSALSSLNGNTVTVDFTGYGPLFGGEIFKGGFYADSGDANSLFNSILSANFTYLGLSGGQSVTKSAVAETANFGGGPINGYVTQFTIVAAPEPGRAMLLMMGACGLMLRRRR